MQNTDIVELNIRDVQVIAFDLLLAFDRFCQKHNLTYYLCGGTLLGAVRHKGFIPWDDDIDLFMSRPAYEKMVQLALQEEIAPDIVFACPENGRFVRPFARFYQTKTRVERFSLNEDSGACVWIDILPVDGITPDSSKWPSLYRNRALMSAFNMATMWKIGRFSRKSDIICKPILFLIGCNVMGRKGGRRFWCNRINKLGSCQPYETAEYVACITGGRYGKGEVMKREAFEQEAEVEFEGHTFKTMSCWKEYLTGIYKDYMQLPPESKRIPHLDYITMSKTDYEEIMQRYPELQLILS